MKGTDNVMSCRVSEQAVGTWHLDEDCSCGWAHHRTYLDNVLVEELFRRGTDCDVEYHNSMSSAASAVLNPATPVGGKLKS